MPNPPNTKGELRAKILSTVNPEGSTRISGMVKYLICQAESHVLIESKAIATMIKPTFSGKVASANDFHKKPLMRSKYSLDFHLALHFPLQQMQMQCDSLY